MNREEYYAAIQQYQENSLEHHGILGQKWGIRRYQNPDGTLTAAGKAREAKLVTKEKNRARKDEAKFHGADRFKNIRKNITTGQKVAAGVAAGTFAVGAAKTISAAKSLSSDGDLSSAFSQVMSANTYSRVSSLAIKGIIAAGLIKTGMTIASRHINDKGTRLRA